MRNNRLFNSILSFGLTLALACALLPALDVSAKETTQTEAEAAETGQETELQRETIEISSAEDFLAFAGQCSLDSWSNDKLVLLNTDIDLSGADFEPIPIFTGVFDGKDHTISGFHYDGDGYVAGLFRYIGAEGLVKNLTVTGNLAVSGEKECTGGLAGVNYGTVENCCFRGTVSGRTSVGGLVGVNEGTGTVQNSQCEGHITGYYSTGGLVGTNHGTVLRCTNRACVNNDSNWVEEDDEMGTGLFFSFNVEDSGTELFSGVDAGGITGYSDGLLTGCKNSGTVGYEHTGYNIGGIAGRQCGILSLCTNSGTVYGRKDIGGIVGQLEPYIQADESQSLVSAVNRLHNLVEKTIEDMEAGENASKRDLDNLANALTISDTLASQVENLEKENADNLQSISDRLQQTTETLPPIKDSISDVQNRFEAAEKLPPIKDSISDVQNHFAEADKSLRQISDELKNLNNDASSYTDAVNDDLKAVNNQLNLVFTLLANTLTDYSEFDVEDIYEDIDIEDADSITSGKTDNCKNLGIVQGDINVGGIAGSMSIDKEDPEDNAAGNVDFQAGKRYFTQCVITDCVNEGYITAKKDGVGGIAGYTKNGSILDSEGYGSVESTEGDYAGGICGESLTAIRRCFALCSVSGNKNVGGIAGYADTLKDCYSMADCTAAVGKTGAIAGQLADYENALNKETGKVSGNYYVSDTLCGIDNISYAGVAAPLTYEELLSTDGIPTAFRHLKVIYRIEDSYLGEQEVPYGQSLSTLKYPEIPEKEGYYGVWPDYSDRVMTGNLLITGEYRENVTVVESTETHEAEAENGFQKPYALIEQRFTEDTVLNVTTGHGTPPASAADRQYVLYDISLEHAEIDDTESFAIRLYNPYEDAEVWAKQNDTWKRLGSKARGHYLQVDMTGKTQTFCVIEQPSDTWLIAAAAVSGAAILLLLILFIKKSRKVLAGRKIKKQEQNP